MKNLIPLFTFFKSLQNHKDFEIGLADYYDLVNLLQSQPDLFINPDELLDYCRLLWLKPQQSDILFSSLFERSFRYLKQELLQEKKITNPEPEQPKEPSKQDKRDNTSQQTNKTTDFIIDDDYNQPLEEKEMTNEGAEDSSDIDQLYLNITQRKGGEEVDSNSEENILQKYQFNFQDKFLPFSQRQVRQTWRTLRKQSLIMDYDSIDVAKTVNLIARQGYYTKPVFKYRPQNELHLLILMEQKGAMLPFQPMANFLAQSARVEVAGQHSTYYFNRTPSILKKESKKKFFVYQDAELIERIDLEKVLNNPAVSVLIISEGGAARNEMNYDFLDTIQDTIELIYKYTDKLVWMNPMPQDRWEGTSASLIQEEIPMFEANELGLKMAIKILRGKLKSSLYLSKLTKQDDWV